VDRESRRREMHRKGGLSNNKTEEGKIIEKKFRSDGGK